MPSSLRSLRASLGPLRYAWWSFFVSRGIPLIESDSFVSRALGHALVGVGRAVL